jgi:hypothetical protein
MPVPTFRVLDDLAFEWTHDCQDEARGVFRPSVALPHGPGGWQIQQTEPLTVTPSILCGTCGIHGFIRDGKWVPA